MAFYAYQELIVQMYLHKLGLLLVYEILYEYYVCFFVYLHRAGRMGKRIYWSQQRC
jgi:hypothetical protein